MIDEDIDTLLDNALLGFLNNKGTEDDSVEKKGTRDKYVEVSKGGPTGKQGGDVFSSEKNGTDSGNESKVPGPTLATNKGLQFDPLGGRKKQQVKGGNGSRSCDVQREKQDDRLTEENDQLVALMQELLGNSDTGIGDTSPMMDTLDALMKQQSSISQQRDQREPGTSGADQEDDFGLPTQVLDGIMKQLVSKDVLYQPMKDICEKYPSWLEKEKDTLDSDDYRKYHDQYTIIAKMCKLYETDPENFGMIMNLLQEVCRAMVPRILFWVDFLLIVSATHFGCISHQSPSLRDVVSMHG